MLSFLRVLRTINYCLFLSLSLCSYTYAQTGTAKSSAALGLEINNYLPDNTSGQINPFYTRQTLQDIVSSSPSSVNPSSWFDQAFCNTIGYLIVRTTGGWVCAQGIPANPVWFGADSTGTNDSTTAFNNAYAASSSVLFPTGTFLFSSAPHAINTPGSKISGSGKTGTVLKVGFATGDFFVDNNGNGSTFRDLAFTSSVTRTSGSYINANSIRIYIEDVYMDIPYVGITLNGNCFLCSVDNVEVHQATPNATAAGSSCMVVGAAGQGTSPGSYVVRNFMCDTNAPLTPAGTCIKILSQNGGIFEAVNCLQTINNLLISPGSGDGSVALMVSDSYFDSSVGGNAVYISPSGTGNVAATWFHNVWASNASANYGILIDRPGSGIVAGFSCVDCHVQGNVTGIATGAAAVTDVSIIGGCIANNTTGFLLFTANTNNVTIRNARFSACDNFAVNTTDINLAAGTSDYIEIQNNWLRGTTAITGAGGITGTHNRIEGNAGYNPVGATAAANVGASPATVCAGPSPETHYLNQSATNTATITQGSQQIAALKDASTFYTINLLPNECYIVTWATTQPKYTKFVH